MKLHILSDIHLEFGKWPKHVDVNASRFLLLDNIEDKGMEILRTHLFQEILVTRSTELQVPYQVIFTTSMMNPKLELTEYTIGPAYTQGERTLRLTD